MQRGLVLTLLASWRNKAWIGDQHQTTFVEIYLNGLVLFIPSLIIYNRTLGSGWFRKCQNYNRGAQTNVSQT